MDPILSTFIAIAIVSISFLVLVLLCIQKLQVKYIIDSCDVAIQKTEVKPTTEMKGSSPLHPIFTKEWKTQTTREDVKHVSVDASNGAGDWFYRAVATEQVQELWKQTSKITHHITDSQRDTLQVIKVFKDDIAQQVSDLKQQSEKSLTFFEDY